MRSGLVPSTRTLIWLRTYVRCNQEVIFPLCYRRLRLPSKTTCFDSRRLLYLDVLTLPLYFPTGTFHIKKCTIWRYKRLVMPVLHSLSSQLINQASSLSKSSSWSRKTSCLPWSLQLPALVRIFYFSFLIYFFYIKNFRC